MEAGMKRRAPGRRGGHMTCVVPGSHGRRPGSSVCKGRVVHWPRVLVSALPIPPSRQRRRPLATSSPTQSSSNRPRSCSSIWSRTILCPTATSAPPTPHLTSSFSPSDRLSASCRMNRAGAQVLDSTHIRAGRLGFLAWANDRHPGGASCFVRGDIGFVRERDSNIVEPVEQAIADVLSELEAGFDACFGCR